MIRDESRKDRDRSDGGTRKQNSQEDDRLRDVFLLLRNDLSQHSKRVRKATRVIRGPMRLTVRIANLTNNLLLFAKEKKVKGVEAV